ncbi:hypothetical protein WT09_15335 [Burkholderia stagnalis]|nr:hypothetical protein WT07_01425 [Burkholderia stagnalis]KVN15344.1 hypothetical protein WT09_15335 [Burkholderia stagnalis]KWE12051.1 hypothetical protein WT47_05950 [Burkholderia stagnalis]KWE20889.1 hypothetical protein WT48_09120 [Burkholderia stagnalis]KWO72658.1 hypothetical protein WU00_15295 [Burkholderia stagnalis]
MRIVTGLDILNTLLAKVCTQFRTGMKALKRFSQIVGIEFIIELNQRVVGIFSHRTVRIDDQRHFICKTIEHRTRRLTTRMGTQLHRDIHSGQVVNKRVVINETRDVDTLPTVNTSDSFVDKTSVISLFLSAHKN